jgi:hypothetical protein
MNGSCAYCGVVFADDVNPRRRTYGPSCRTRLYYLCAAMCRLGVEKAP